MFGTVDSAIAGLAKALTRLEKVKERKKQETVECKEKMKKIGQQAAAAETEAHRAETIISDISKIIEV